MITTQRSRMVLAHGLLHLATSACVRAAQRVSDRWLIRLAALVAGLVVPPVPNQDALLGGDFWLPSSHRSARGHEMDALVEPAVLVGWQCADAANDEHLAHV